MRILLTALTFMWSGLVLGISFVEAPLKFQAPNITRELGLGIGQLVFTVLNRIELLVAFIIIISLWRLKIHRQIWLFYAIPITLLLVQTLWLLPVLDERIVLILAGEKLASTYHHILFILLEVIKLIALLFAGSFFMKKVVLKK